jgi:alanyl-tRNA synthetase
VPTNYDTDLFLPIMERVEALSGRRRRDSRENDVAMKVIADHSRAAAFLIADGVLPSNEGRGYVLRRIMRRAIRYGRNLGLDRPFLHETVQKVFDIMESAYPELKKSAAFILNVVKNEESKFSETLDVGLRLLNETIEETERSGSRTIAGDVIFRLYDTYGFPVDVITDVVKGRDIGLDLDGYHSAMEEQKARSRSSKTFSGVGEAFKSLTSRGVRTVFTGYEVLETLSEVILIVRDAQEVRSAGPGDTVEIVTERTPFYSESGGQAGDAGCMEGRGFRVRIDNTLSDPTGLKIHRGVVESGTLNRMDSVLLKVDRARRAATALNHTATHLLHAALRKVLGDHVKQSGSLVTSERLRFDFTHFSAMSREEIQAVETEVNDRIRDNAPVGTLEMGMEDAVKSGATALFEEKYGDRVRVVSMGDFSRELCGGTHTDRSGNIGLFVIVSEGGIASGVRRIEALTGERALAHLHQSMGTLQEAADLFKAPREELPSRIRTLMTEKKTLEKELESLKARIASKSVDDMESSIRVVDGIRILSKKVQIDNPSTAVVTPDLTGRYHAGSIVKNAAAIVGGGGGGRPDMAQAGGTKPEHLDKALESVFQA